MLGCLEAMEFECNLKERWSKPFSFPFLSLARSSPTPKERGKRLRNAQNFIRPDAELCDLPHAGRASVWLYEDDQGHHRGHLR